jgi:hypothetical protein
MLSTSRSPNAGDLGSFTPQAEAGIGTAYKGKQDNLICFCFNHLSIRVTLVTAVIMHQHPLELYAQSSIVI